MTYKCSGGTVDLTANLVALGAGFDSRAGRGSARVRDNWAYNYRLKGLSCFLRVATKSYLLVGAMCYVHSNKWGLTLGALFYCLLYNFFQRTARTFAAVPHT